MSKEKKIHPKIKLKLHPRNKHQARYKFHNLIRSFPSLKPFVIINQYGDESIDFFNPQAVQCLNQALIKHYYDIDNWSVPKGYLSPPIPGRVDYIHYVADLLQLDADPYKRKPIPQGSQIKCIDIGTGASCIYPLLANAEYGWSFEASDSDPKAIESAQNILDANPEVKKDIQLIWQKNPDSFFENVIDKNDRFYATFCNPPFHRSAKEAKEAAAKKLKNLKKKTVEKPVLNFGGMENELWYEGGERSFLSKLIRESAAFQENVLWFTSLVSKHENLKPLYNVLREVKAVKVKTIEMGQGNKTSRFIAWTFKKDNERPYALLTDSGKS